MRLTRLAFVLAVVAAATVLTGCAASGFTATGTILVPSDVGATADANGVEHMTNIDELKGKDTCVSKSGYSDVSGGAQVSIFSSTGETIAFGDLVDAGVSDRSGAVCELTFEISGVPVQDSDIYAVGAGGDQRGTTNATREELESGLTLTLGG